MQTNTLAIDFGTSNSAAALAWEGGVFRVPVEEGAETLPTAVFFPEGGGAMRIGAKAGAALVAGDEGRYMRALKSVLGVPLFHESRLIEGKRRTLADVVAAFIAELKARAEAATGQRFSRALSGRPVRFHSEDAGKDAQAEVDLRGCYLAAGFDEVEFLAEPEAAAWACAGMGGAEGLGLIVDIGGGTSDFTVFRSEEAGRIEVLASHGIRLGGTDFDRAISMAQAMPLLGLGSELRREMGAGLLPVPRAPFGDLATWAKIPFLYTPETRRMAADLVKFAVEPERLERFATVLELELGHELAFAVERGKIAANGGAAGEIAMGFITPGLAAGVTAEEMGAALGVAREALREAMGETLALAGVGAGEVARVILVGGSSLMGLVGEEAEALCPGAAQLRSEAFTAVVDGLALAARG